MADGETLLALGCFQSVSPSMTTDIFWAFGSDTASWYFTSCGNFVGRRFLRGGRLRRGSGYTRSFEKNIRNNKKTTEQARPTGWISRNKKNEKKTRGVLIYSIC